MDAISRAISEAASNENGRSSVHWLLLEENGKTARTAITEGELAQLKRNKLACWSDEEGCYVMTERAKQALAEA